MGRVSGPQGPEGRKKGDTPQGFCRPWRDSILFLAQVTQPSMAGLLSLALWATVPFPSASGREERTQEASDKRHVTGDKPDFLVSLLTCALSHIPARCPCDPLRPLRLDISWQLSVVGEAGASELMIDYCSVPAVLSDAAVDFAGAGGYAVR